MNKLLTALQYDPETGHFTWQINHPRVRRGMVAGAKNAGGYVHIKVCGRDYYAHRLAWFFTFGRWPVDTIDHINGVKSDNRISNLRELSREQNSSLATVGRPRLNGTFISGGTS